MSKPSAKVPDCTAYVDRFADYYARNSTWGAFHALMDDGNFGLNPVAFCETAEERELGCLLASMSQSQRRKVRDLAESRGRPCR